MSFRINDHDGHKRTPLGDRRQVPLGFSPAAIESLTQTEAERIKGWEEPAPPGFVGIIDHTGSRSGSAGNSYGWGVVGMPAGTLTKIEANAYLNPGTVATADVAILDENRTVLSIESGLVSTRIPEINDGAFPGVDVANQIEGSWEIPEGGGIALRSDFGAVGQIDSEMVGYTGLYQGSFLSVGQTYPDTGTALNARYTFE